MQRVVTLDSARIFLHIHLLFGSFSVLEEVQFCGALVEHFVALEGLLFSRSSRLWSNLEVRSHSLTFKMVMEKYQSN